MDLSDLRTELLGRGFDFLSPSRADAYLNAAYKELNDAADWPWLQATTSGTAPVTITDLRGVLYVFDETNDHYLQGRDVRELVDEYHGDLTTTGIPRFYWQDGLTTVKVQPPNTSSTLSVRYVKDAPVLADDTDVPIVPSGHHLLIVTIAQRRAAGLDEAELDDVSVIEREIQAELGRMASTYLNRNLDGPGAIYVTGASTDW